MKCKTVLDALYGETGEDVSQTLFFRLQYAFHFVYCSACAGERRRVLQARRLLLETFLPQTPDITGTVMAAIREKEDIALIKTPDKVSLRLWVITGFFILLSLTSAYFGNNFFGIIDIGEHSVLLPISITIGIIITAYGVMLIISHLDALCKKFGLHNKIPF